MNRAQKIMLGRILSAAALLLLVLLLPLPNALRLFAFLVPYLLISWDVLWQALRNMRHGRLFDENFLMSVATVGAFCIGEYPEGVFVMLFYQVGELFQSRAVDKSRRSIADLMHMLPAFANLERDGVLVQLDPAELEPGQIIVVKPGEKIPLDGVVMEGVSSLNTMALTGESLPRSVQVGADVLSGCVNLTGLLRVRVTKRFEDSTVAKILELVESAAENKAKSENFITRFARYYTPCVVIAAAFLALIPPLFLGADFSVWIYRALSFLVISCPCALVLSVPLSFFGGIGGAARKGILVKGAVYLEQLSKATIVAFDKTGTLTQGRFSVSQIAAQEGFTAAQLLELAALAEAYSDHPLAVSLRAAYEGTLVLSRVGDLQILPGLGLSTTVDGRSVSVGNRALMDSLGLAAPLEHGAGSAVHVAVEGQYAGYILLADAPKPNAKQALSALRALGIRKTVMLTGDRESVALAMAQDFGIDEVQAELLPQDKVACVERLLAQKSATERLIFVGDGINDAPVLSRADIGIAMGALGADAAMEAADVVIMDDDPQKVALAIRIARKTMGITRQNIVFSLGIKAVVLGLSIFGISSMWHAVLADVGVSVLAILNAMRALKSD